MDQAVNEARRVEALRDLGVLDSVPEEVFDGIAQAAAAICGVPMSSLVLVDAERTWLKAQVGLGGLGSGPRHLSFCTHAICDDPVFEVRNAVRDDRFATNPFVTGDMGVRFYAGAPIRLRDGYRVGTVCVLDRRPRRLNRTQRDLLQGLALAAARALENRKAFETQQRLASSLETAMTRLRASENNLRRLYETTPAMLHSIDPKGRLLVVSDTWLATLGYVRDEVIGRLASDFLSPASRIQAVTVEMPAFFTTGRREGVRYQMVCKDGRLIDVLMSARLEYDEAGLPVRSMTVVQDVTTRLAAERALMASEGNYRLLADATSDVITQLDLNLVRRYVSPACRRVLGYEPEEFIGITPSATVHPDDAAEVKRVMQTLLGGSMPGDRATVTNRMRHKQGHWVWLEAGLALVRDVETGAPHHLVCALRDISERLAAETLQRARAAAERDAESKSEFLSNMSHELRTPLTGILGIHRILQQDPDLTPSQRKYVALAHDAGQSLMGIINDVLDFSKMEAGQLQIESVPFDLPALVQACCDCVRGEADRKSLLIEAHLDASLPLVGDPTRLRQVLLNLMSNAVKFTPSGHVWVEARHDREADRLLLSVADSGAGIPTNRLDAIFERFRQADGSVTRQYGGTGLGLAICKRLVELMGGTISVRSVAGSGSTFTIVLPARVADGTLPASQGEIEQAVSRSVLLVEDNLLSQEVVATMLHERGHVVTVAGNGAEAVEIVKGPDRFDVILMDVQMPILDGFSATRAIRAHEAASAWARTPIIGFTANASERDFERCRASGMDGRITKPVDWASLFSVIDELTLNKAAVSGVAEPAPVLQVLDRQARHRLSRIIGKERLVAIVDGFVADIESRGPTLAEIAAADLARLAHAWITMAGYLGFSELSASAMDVERAINAGQGPVDCAKLQQVILRAVAAEREQTKPQAA